MKAFPDLPGLRGMGSGFRNGGEPEPPTPSEDGSQRPTRRGKVHGSIMMGELSWSPEMTLRQGIELAKKAAMETMEIAGKHLPSIILKTTDGKVSMAVLGVGKQFFYGVAEWLMEIYKPEWVIYVHDSWICKHGKVEHYPVSEKCPEPGHALVVYGYDRSGNSDMSVIEYTKTQSGMEFRELEKPIGSEFEVNIVPRKIPEDYSFA